MRELPPESLLRTLHSDRPADAPYTVYGFTRDQVLAIQRQAYEDGLRDAATICDDLAEINRKAMTDSMWQQEECASAIRTRAMLTALQKEEE